MLLAGEPMGLMGGQEGPAAEFGAAFVEAAAVGNSPPAMQPLYVELRHGKETLDPAEWFVMNPVITPATGSDAARDNGDTKGEDAPAEQVRTTE